MTAISLRHVHKRYGKNSFTIRDVNLEVSSGEFCVFVGPSGCGKSTLLRLIAGLEDVSSGEIIIDGRLVNQVAPAKRGVAMVFQSYALYPHMTVYENMAFGLRTMGQSSTDTDNKVQKAAKILGLEPLLKRLPKELSGGQRQRVAIGRAIVRDPQVFLFDEPLSNLDAALRVQTRLEIAKLHRETGTTSLFYVTHDQVEAMTLASHIVLLNTGPDVQKYGSVAQYGPPLELYHRPQSKFVAGFIGSPKMNFISGVLAGPSKGDSTDVKVGNVVLPVRATSPNAQSGAAVSLGIRPEHLSLAAPNQPGALSARVSYLEQLGEASYVYADTSADGLITVRVENKNLPKIGDNVGLYVAPDKAHIFDSEGQAFQRTVSFA